MRRLALLIVLWAVAAACTGDGAPGYEGGPAAASGAEGLRAPMTPAGPIRGLLLGDAFVDGVVEGQRLAFTPEDTRAIGVVWLGGEVEPGSTLGVTWFRGFGEAREELFTHEIPVGPDAIAFSEGVAPSGLAPGFYEIEASLEGHAVRTPWIVQRPDEGTASGGLARMATAQAQSTLEDWELPSPGESGSSDWDTVAPSPAASPPTTCEVDAIHAGMSPMTDVTASAFGLGPCTEFTLTASVVGTPQVVASEDDLRGPISSIHGAADVCELPGGSDLPGTVVRFEISGSATGSEAYTLPDLSSVLIAGIEATPAEGARVEAGDRIGVQALAMLMPPAQGIKVLYVDDGSELLESVGNASGTDRPIACDVGRYFAFLQATYVVPQEPPPVVRLCANAEGFDGTVATDCASFFTSDGQTWKGTLRATNSGRDCEGDEDGPITLKVNGGEVTGSFELSGSYTCEGVTVPTSGSVTLSGTLDKAGFTLGGESTEGLLLGGLACWVDQPFEIPVTGDTAEAHSSMTAPSGDVYECDVELHVADPG